MLNVPRETISEFSDNPELLFDRLSIYEKEISKWNSKINLVSRGSIGDLWQRHFLDSLQLAKYVPRGTSSVMDVGSGGGFPALVLAAAGLAQSWELIESDQRKSVFLRHVAREIGVKVNVHSERIENIKSFPSDLIMARALADLNSLLEMTSRFSHSMSTFLFPKGKNWKLELTQAKENWTMRVENFQSLTDSDAQILRISNLERKNL